MQVTLPDGPVPMTELVPVVHDLASAIHDFTASDSATAGRPITCSAGCSACCQQLVPVTPAEIRTVAAAVSRLEPEHRARIDARLDALEPALDRRFGLDTLEHLERQSREARHDIGLAYFRMGHQCPFLEQGVCSIRSDRPAACREYAVLSPPVHCADLSDGQEPLRLPANPSNTLTQVRFGGEPTPLMPLAVFRYWMRRHADEAQPTEDATALLQRVVRGIVTGTVENAPGAP